MARRPPPQERALIQRLRTCRAALRGLVVAIEEGPVAFEKAHREATAVLLQETAEELAGEFHGAKLRLFRREYEAWQEHRESGSSIDAAPLLEDAADLVRRLVAAGGEEPTAVAGERDILVAIAEALRAKLSKEANDDA